MPTYNYPVIIRELLDAIYANTDGEWNVRLQYIADELWEIEESINYKQ